MESQPLQQPIEILLVADNRGQERALEDELAEVAPRQFILESAITVEAALAAVGRKRFDLIVLDFSLPGGGPELFPSVRDHSGDVPIVILTGVDDEQLAIKAVHDGAQDYIVHGHVNTQHLAQSLHYAIERQRLREKLVNESFLDALTGIYNRRGFTNLASQQLRMADRTKRGILLFFVDLDGLKLINDTYGHRTGDQALVETAAILRETFRRSDILSRLGGDEFAVLAIETDFRYKGIVLKRLQANTEKRNMAENLPYHLSLSVGVATYDPENPCSIDALIETADGLMYEQKRGKKEARG
jgi:two-component system, cell cycle response regulator